MTPTATDYRDHALRRCGPWPSHVGDTASCWSSRAPLVAEELKLVPRRIKGLSISRCPVPFYALPAEPQSNHSKDDISDERGCRGSSGGGWWWAEEDVTLNRQHQDPEDGRAEATDGVDSR